MKKSSKKTRPRARIVWDEENLEYIEANKSPKQKITEPKTPYYAPENGDDIISPLADENQGPVDHAVDAEAVKRALSEVASTSNSGWKRPGRGSGWTSSEDEADEKFQGDESSRLSFKEHRRKHYDEYLKLKMFRSKSNSKGDDDGDVEMEEQRIGEMPVYDQESCLAGGMCAIGLQENGTSVEREPHLENGNISSQ